MAILKMYDERISEQVKLLNRASATRHLTDGDGEVRLEEIITASGSETGPSRRGPILSNVQIASPRQFLDSASEATSITSPADASQ